MSELEMYITSVFISEFFFPLFTVTSENDSFTNVLEVIKYFFFNFRACVNKSRGTFRGILYKIQNFNVD